MKPDATRPKKVLSLAVKDSGRTWFVMYDEIDRIPGGEIEKGDVFIVRHPTNPGVMFMQATSPRPGRPGRPLPGWTLENVAAR